MKSIKHFFWFCSGANRSLLNRCPTEASKFTGIGAAVFFTGVLAALSGGYAFYTVFENPWWSAAFALLWGAIIFNLDRFIVATMRKKKGKKWLEFVQASPRILLAVLLAIVITKPLELRIFSKEIDRKLVILEEQIYQKEIAEIDQRYVALQSEINSQMEGFKSEIATKAAQRDRLYEEARKEADGTGGSMQRNAGPIYQLKKADADKAQTELEELSARYVPLIAAKQANLDSLAQARQTEINAIKRNPWNGLAAQLEALKVLTAENRGIAIANYFIIALFIMLECAPILVKLIAPRGPYDDLLEIREHFYKNHNLEQISAMDHSTYEKLKYFTH
ncbi:DUF4407 domain-containing protein [Roseivirga pacifica]|uniref:DUF4407 domain-containing protein n=1 Tax=Roseivirga pacifica TaxID=1267423 RepID=UPI003BA9CFF5